MSCYVMLCHVMSCYVMSCYVMLCYVMLCYVMLCYLMLCYVILCYIMLCYVISCYVISCHVRRCKDAWVRNVRVDHQQYWWGWWGWRQRQGILQEEQCVVQLSHREYVRTIGWHACEQHSVKCNMNKEKRGSESEVMSMDERE